MRDFTAFICFTFASFAKHLFQPASDLTREWDVRFTARVPLRQRAGVGNSYVRALSRQRTSEPVYATAACVGAVVAPRAATKDDGRGEPNHSRKAARQTSA